MGRPFWSLPKTFIVSVLLGMIALLGACASIPPGAESANAKVSAGITVMELNTQAIITAWRKTLHLAIQEEFERIHKSAEAAVRKKRSVPVGTLLNSSQQQEVAGVVLLVFEQANHLIDEKIAQTASVIQQNAAMVKAANDNITRLLASAGRIGAARARLVETMGTFLPLPDVSSILAQAIDATRTK